MSVAVQLLENIGYPSAAACWASAFAGAISAFDALGAFVFDDESSAPSIAYVTFPVAMTSVTGLRLHVGSSE